MIDHTLGQINVFVSYSWRPVENKEAVHKLAGRLEEHFNVWIDKYKMSGNTNKAMARGIDNADIVLICFNDEYKASENCQKEADYSSSTKKLLLPIRMAKETTLDGLLGFILGSALWVDYSNPDKLDSVFQQVLDQIDQIISDEDNRRKLLANRKLALVNCLPSPGKFYNRHVNNDPTPTFTDAIKSLCEGRAGGCDGLLVVSGSSGVGKTSFVNHVIHDVRFTRDLMQTNGNNIRSLFWVNCKRWSNENAFDDAQKDAFMTGLIKLADFKCRKIDTLSALAKCYQPLFVFDDVFHMKLIEAICELSSTKSLPAVVICESQTAESLKMLHLARWESLVRTHIELNEFTDEEIAEYFKEVYQFGKRIPLKPEEIIELAKRCSGLPRAADSLADRFKDVTDRRTAEQEHHKIVTAGSNVGADAQKLPMKTAVIAMIAGKVPKFLQPKLRKESVADDAKQTTDEPTTEPPKAIVLLGAPEYSSYYSRTTEEQKIWLGVRNVCDEQNAKRGVFMICGGGGIGKSTLVACALRNLKDALQQRCNIHLVLWFNCYQWRTGLQSNTTTQEFVNALLDVASREASDEARKMWKDIRKMVEWFEKQRRRLLIVLDDVFHGSILDTFRNQCDTLSTIVITRDPSIRGFKERLLKFDRGDPTGAVNPLCIGEMSDESLVEMFETSFDLKDRISTQDLNDLARRCCGSPLVASQIAAQFADCSDSKKSYDIKLKRILANFGTVVKSELSNSHRQESTAKDLFYTTFSQLSDETKRRYFYFLLFNPVEQIRRSQLSFLWQQTDDETIEDTAQMERLAIVRPSVAQDQYWPYRKEHAFLIHQMLYEAAFENAKKAFQVESITILRQRIMAVSSIEDFDLARLDDAAQIDGILAFLDRAMKDDKADLLQTILQKFSSADFSRYEDLVRLDDAEEPARDSRGNTALMLSAEIGLIPLVKILDRHNPKAASLQNLHGQTALMKAAAQGSLEVVQLLYERSPDTIKLQDNEGESALMMACLYGSLQVAKFLADQWPEGIRVANNNGMPPVTRAVLNGHGDIVKYLATKCPEVLNCDDGNGYGMTALMWAAWKGDFSIVRFLIDNWPDCANSPPKSRSTALGHAAQKGHIQVVRYLAEKCPEQVNMKLDGDSNPLIEAANCGHMQVVRFLAERYPELVMQKKHGGKTALMSEKVLENIDVLKFLVEKCPDAVKLRDAEGRTAFFIAVGKKQIRSAKFLAELWPEAITLTSDCGWTALFDAARNGDLEMAKFLIDKCPQLVTMTHKRGTTALIKAAESGNFELVNLLADQWPDGVKMADDEGKTPLFAAAECGNVDSVRFLAELWPDAIRLMGPYGKTALMRAANEGKLEVVKLLAEACPDTIILQDKSHETALYHAASKGHLDVVKYLAEKCPDTMKMQQCYKWTPLFVATGNGHIEVVKFLADKCPETLKWQAAYGFTPLLHATRMMKEDIAKFLAEKCPEALHMADEEGKTPLMEVASRAQTKMVKFFLEKSPEVIKSIDNDGLTILATAAINANADLIKYLHEMWPEAISILTKDGSSVLHLAAGHYFHEVVTYVYEQWPEAVKLQNGKGQVPLMRAASSYYPEDVKFLGEAYPDAVKLVDNLGETCLLKAARGGNFESVKYIADKWPDAISLQSNNGRTPLMEAAWERHWEVVKFLAEKCPEMITLQDAKGRTAIKLAAAKYNREIVKHLAAKCGEEIDMDALIQETRNYEDDE